MSEVAIINLKTFDAAPRGNGDVVVASFDCEMRGIRLLGCTLLQRRLGTLFVQLPVFRVAGRSGGDVRFKDRVYIFDVGLMNGLRKAATQAYDNSSPRRPTSDVNRGAPPPRASPRHPPFNRSPGNHHDHETPDHSPRTPRHHAGNPADAHA